MARGHAPQASGTRQTIERITVQGFRSSVSSGDPALPCRSIFVVLPPNADMSSVRVLTGSYSTRALPGSYDIAPVPAVAASSREVEYGLGKSVTAGRNALVYGRNDFYPREHVRVVRVGNLRSWNVAELEFWPYAYNPATGKLRVVNAGDIALDYATRPAKPTTADPLAVGMSGFVENGAQAASWYATASSNPPSPGYAIITTGAIASASTALAEFAGFQTARGFSVRIAAENDWGGGVGDTAAERIRAWLRNNYLSLGIQYVLLIGNPNPTSGDVPMKMLWPRRWSTSYRDAPSDYYYADLTGNWDLDADGYAGEEPDDLATGGVDRIPEVYVGRIPYYGNIAELDSILRKTIAYESSAKGDWVDTALLAMKPMDADTPSYQLGEEIMRDFGWYSGVSPDRIYDGSYGMSMPPEHTPCGYDIVQSEWAKGAGLVFWMTHGLSNHASSVFSSSRCAYLDDSKPSIVYMASCSNGKPEDADNLGYSVLARGGATTLSASRVSWYYLGETSFTASDSVGGFGYQYARFLLGGGESCGRAAMDARLANFVGIWVNHLVHNLYGDPSLVYRLPRAAQEVTGVAGAKLLPDGVRVHIGSAVIGRVGDGQVFFVQDPNRCAGMRVTGVWAGVGSPQPGRVVALSGLLGTENGMRVLTEARIDSAGTSAALIPIGMSARSIRNPRTFGLLVAVWGRVLSSSGSSFTITGGSPEAGLMVTCGASVPVPPVGAWVRVVGASTPGGVVVCGAEDVVAGGS